MNKTFNKKLKEVSDLMPDYAFREAFGIKEPPAQISTETLYHFNCPSCKKWWSIAWTSVGVTYFETPAGQNAWWCPWCGKMLIIENGEIKEMALEKPYKGLVIHSKEEKNESS